MDKAQVDTLMSTLFLPHQLDIRHVLVHGVVFEELSDFLKNIELQDFFQETTPVLKLFL